ncbi:MAG: Gfo/Idh/MocA family oxidoreductase [Saprospiraceae bacterium]|nr:Gfo/Idh/MocA family oxidoreductase [Saprospiraceae bacterium]MBP7699024.1 Gfo/Idh/MocA family oxidoreductase [Saprospiraceae bacterium]
MVHPQIKIGVIGVGHLGKIHLRCLQQIPTIQVVGFFDTNTANAEAAKREFNIPQFNTLEAMFVEVEAVDIVTPTITHFAIAAKAMQAGKHVFIEKPVTQTPNEAKQLIALADALRVKVQVGHVERFNPAMLSIKDVPVAPMFIEAHRLATFNPRGTDVSVVLDLMIHDLDLILMVVKSAVKQISASGVCIVSPTHDIANARIEFENGCTANITASRLSMKQMRKFRMFQNDAYISLDFLEKNAQTIRLYEDSHKPPIETLLPLETLTGTKWIAMDMPTPLPVNAIKMELETFAEAIQNDTTPFVTLQDGFAALSLAYQVLEKIN